MKSPSLLFVLSSFILLSSCSPVIYYLGDSYEPTSAVEIYYDASEVKKPYKTIGRMTKEVSLSGDVEKKYMVREAKKAGRRRHHLFRFKYDCGTKAEPTG